MKSLGVTVTTDWWIWRYHGTQQTRRPSPSQSQASNLAGNIFLGTYIHKFRYIFIHIFTEIYPEKVSMSYWQNMEARPLPSKKGMPGVKPGHLPPEFKKGIQKLTNMFANPQKVSMI